MELTIDQALQKGVEAHKAEQIQEADRLYTAILKAQPKHPDANHNMGMLAVGVGKVELALPFFKTALEASPSTGQFWISYIGALIKLERLADAKAVLDQAKDKGAKGDAFDQLEQKLNVPKGVPVEDVATSQETEQVQQNILDTLKLDQAIKLATSKFKEGSLKEARHIYNDILIRFPKNKKAVDGAKALRGGATDKASEIQNPPQDQLQHLINVYKNGHLQKALERADGLLQQFPSSIKLYNIKGGCYVGLGQFEAAEEAYRTAIKLNPGYPGSYSNMGNCLKLQGKLEGAMEAYSKALAIEPDIAETNYNMGNMLQLLGKSEGAIEAYNKAVAFKPDYSVAHNNMGNALKEQGKLEEAIAAFSKALEIKPDFAEAYNNMGNAFQDQGALKEAIEAYKKALEIKPDFAEAYNNMGNALKEQGSLEKAIEAFSKALEIKPDYAEAYNNMGNAFQEQGGLEEAIEAYNKALAIKPDYAEAYNNMGIANQDQGKLEEAIEAYNKALAIKPDHAEAYNNMGNALKEQGKLDEAIEAYKKTLAIKPDFASVYINLGTALQTQGKLEQAIAAFKKDGSPKSQIYLLKCLYKINEQAGFYDQLDYLIDQNENNAVIGSYISRSQVRYGISKENPFCNDPLKYVLHTNLTDQCDFKNIFVKGATDILSEDIVQNRSQSLLTNGIQTTGNVFNQIGNFTNRIQSIIRSEIENYRINFKDSKEGLIKSWPADYEIYGWLVSMKTGGKLAAHMHDKGWISGSIYINVPPKVNKDSGNLVVCLDSERDSQSIDVVTGSLCLFPSSLLHYTIPFEADENRIVLAFDIIPK